MSLSADYLERYQDRKRAEASAKLSYMQITGQCTAHPHIVAAANEADVMRDQFEALMEAGATDSRYQGMRAILYSPFEETATECSWVMTAGGLRR